MSSLGKKLRSAQTSSAGPVVEAIYLGLDDRRRPLVRLADSTEVSCRLASSVAAELHEAPLPVLLLWSDSASPVIVSVVLDTVPEAEKTDTSELSVAGSLREESGKVLIAADDELLLGCGKSSILLRKDGVVVIKGERVTSRARNTQKIKGANVLIN